MGATQGSQDSESANVEQASENGRTPDDNGGSLLDWTRQGVASIVDRFWLRRRPGTDIYDDEKSGGNAASSKVVTNTRGLVYDARLGHIYINERSTDGQTPLTAAIRSKDLGRIQQLLQHSDIEINFPEKSQVSIYRADRTPPIIVATREKVHEILRALLEAGADVEVRDSSGYSALYYASEDGDVEAVAMLLKYKPNYPPPIHARDEPLLRPRCEPIHQACRYGHLEVVKQLVASGCAVNPDKEGNVNTPLNLAIRSKNEDLCLYLLQNGAKFKGHTDYDTKTFLNACIHGLSRVVQYYIEHGSRVPFQGQQSLAFSYAVRYGDLQRIARQAKLKQNSGMPMQETLAELNEVLLTSVTVIQLLCEGGGSMDSCDPWLPLVYALRAKNIAACIVLLMHGAQWDDKCDQASEKGNVKSLQNFTCRLYDIFIDMLDDGTRYRFRSRYPLSVKSLKNCCRTTIRNCVGRRTPDRSKRKSILPTLQTLPLPVLLLDFLCYKDVQLDDIVTESRELYMDYLISSV